MAPSATPTLTPAPNPPPNTPMPDFASPEEDILGQALTRTNTTTPNLFSLAGWTVLITGGGRGLGIELAHAVVEAGGCVACVDILEQPSQEEWLRLKARAKQLRVSASYVKCDITDEAELGRTFAGVAERAERLGWPLNGVVGCAGVQQVVDAVDYPVDDWNRVMNVNVTGAFLTAKHAAREFMRQGCKGSIVLIASMSGTIANRSLRCSAYNTSKAAVLQMARSFAQEWGQYGIRVNTLSPGYIRTAMTDKLLQDEPEVEETWMRGAMLGRLGAPADFKGPAIFLLAPASSWMTGADLRIDGGHCASA